MILSIETISDIREQLDELPQFRKIRNFALDAHCDHLCGHERYEEHLEAVLLTAIAFDLPSHVVLSSYLYDILAKTDIEAGVVRELFGDAIADIISHMTDLPSANRKEPSHQFYKSLVKNKDLLSLKLSVLIAQVSNCVSESNEKTLQLYRNMYPRFRGKLKSEGELDEMWLYLDQLISGH